LRGSENFNEIKKYDAVIPQNNLSDVFDSGCNLGCIDPEVSLLEAQLSKSDNFQQMVSVAMVSCSVDKLIIESANRNTRRWEITIADVPKWEGEAPPGLSVQHCDWDWSFS
jgi:hypothetical protein